MTRAASVKKQKNKNIIFWPVINHAVRGLFSLNNKRRCVFDCLDYDGILVLNKDAACVATVVSFQTNMMTVKSSQGHPLQARDEKLALRIDGIRAPAPSVLLRSFSMTYMSSIC